MATVIQKRTAQKIVDTVKDVCGHDINFIDSNGVIFASTDTSRIGDFHEIGKQVVASGETIEVESDDSFFGTHKGVNIPFVHNKELIAVIGISGKPDEVRKFAYLAQKITSLILREHELDSLNYGKKNQLNYMIRALVNNEAVPHDYFMDFVDEFHLALDHSYRTMIIKLDSRYNPSNISMMEQHIYHVLDQAGSSLYTFSYPNEYLCIIEEKQYEQWSYLFPALSTKYQGIIKIGVGNLSSLTKQHISYASAQITVNSLLDEQGFAVFDDLDLEILLGSIPEETKTRYLQKVVSCLNDYDLSLLQTYYACEMSLKETGEKLFLHKNTLQYQLDHIWKKCGYNPRSFQDAVLLYLAVRMT